MRVPHRSDPPASHSLPPQAERGSSRRRFFAQGFGAGAAVALGSAACAPGADGNAVAPSELYVGLGRLRQIAILDASSDRVIGRIPLQAFGERGAPAQITVGPSGTAAVLPLVSTSADVGLIQTSEPSGRSAAAGAAPAAPRAVRRAALLHLREPSTDSATSGDRQAKSTETPAGSDPSRRDPLRPRRTLESAQRLTADAEGNAYVLLADGGALLRPTVAVVDMHSGEVRRNLPVADPGESVLALLAQPDGRRLYVAIWNWGPFRPAGFTDIRGRLVAIDVATGAVEARAPLPADAAVTEMCLAAAPPGAPGAGSPGSPCVYATTSRPGPSRDESMYIGLDRKHSLVALDADTLAPLSTWHLERSPSALAVMANGSRAYFLGGAGMGGAWTRELSCLDMATGTTAGRWPLPEGCFSLALSPVGKVYVADALGDRLWRLDLRQSSMLTDIPLPGAPLSLATRPA